MAITIGGSSAGKTTSFSRFSTTRFASKHLFLLENTVGGLDLPSLFALSGSFPYNEIQTFPVERDNANFYLPEVTDVNVIDTEFYETADNAVFNYVNNWMNLIYRYDRSGQKMYNLPINFKQDLYVFRLDSVLESGREDFRRTFGLKYTGCFPTRIGDFNFDASDPNVLTLGVTFQADSVEPITNGIETPYGGDSVVFSREVQSQTPDVGINNSNPVEGVTYNEPVTIGTGNPVEGTSTPQPDVAIGSSNPVEGVTPPIESPELRKQQGDARWAQYRNEGTARTAQAQGERAQRVGDGVSEWVKQLSIAAAKSGINIAERKLYYLAYRALNR